MTRDVVCISAADGALGAEVARVVAERLGFRLLDQEVVVRAAESTGVRSEEVADVERRRTLLGRLAGGVGGSIDPAAYAMVGVPPGMAEGETPSKAALREAIATAIEEAAREGKLVIFAHAASLTLGSRPNVLRVFVTAPIEARRRRLAEERSLGEAEAAKAIAAADKNRADYLKRFHRTDEELPTLYDLVLNTERLSPAQAALLVAAATGIETAEPAPAA